MRYNITLTDRLAAEPKNESTRAELQYHTVLVRWLKRVRSSVQRQKGKKKESSEYLRGPIDSLTRNEMLTVS